MRDFRPNDGRAIARTLNPLDTNPKAWLAAIVESSEDAIIGKSIDGVIRSWNRGATRMFGYQPSEIIGRSILTLIPSDLRHEEPAIVARLLRGERIDHYETIRLSKDGTRIEVSLSVSPIRDESGEIIGAAKIARDITEANRLHRAARQHGEQLQEMAAELEQQIDEAQGLQEELEQTNEQLSTALAEAHEASAAKSQFLATMSHELRTPLNAIGGYVDLIDMGLRGPLTPEQRHDLGRIKYSQEVLLRLINEVLSFAKIESGQLTYRVTDVHLDEILSTLETLVAPQLGKKTLTYALVPCGGEAIVSADRDKVQQILLNLLSNAVKFTDVGGIEVRCDVGRRDTRVHVRDTGGGIRPALLDSIFEPFVQGDQSLTRKTAGTGLGLAISRQMARAMGGDITVESTPGIGSTFTLCLPNRRA